MNSRDVLRGFDLALMVVGMAPALLEKIADYREALQRGDVTEEQLDELIARLQERSARIQSA